MQQTQHQVTTLQKVTTTKGNTQNKLDIFSFLRKESIAKMVVVVGQKTTKKNENNPTKIWWGYFFVVYLSHQSIITTT
jgi:hypothetical protein